LIPTLGNNDNRLHDNATTDADKSEFFPFLYDLWINGLTGNASLQNDSNVKDTFYNGAYYRVDVNDKVSVLALNTMYWGFDNDLHVEGQEGEDMMAWIQDQFDNAGTRKFILTSHIYAGTRYNKEDLLKLDKANAYFKLIRDNHDKVIFESFGHDHYADLRYHSSEDVADLPNLDGDKF
jgi:hypothetical protein